MNDDNAKRLTSLENKKSDTSVIATYQFPILDGNGNRTQVVQNEPLVPTISVGSATYGYNTQKNRLLSAGTASFGYDDEGQLSTGYGSSYSFDYFHRLTHIGSAYQFSYDGNGNRLQAVRNGTTTRYIYDAAGNLLAETDGSNNILCYYIYGLGLMALVTPLDQVYCYHFNAIGSTIAITDQSQAMVNKYAYDPFGNIANQEENLPQPPQPFKLAGQFGVMTEPNGFYYMRARYYDPDVGRFISEDPSGFDGGDVNLMAYVGNNPINWVDPLGLRNWGTAFGQALEGTLGNILGYGFDITGMVLDTSGDWGYYGSASLGAAGAVAGTFIAPGIGTAIGGLAGGIIGGLLGGLLDPPWAGQLNYDEVTGLKPILLAPCH